MIIKCYVNEVRESGDRNIAVDMLGDEGQISVSVVVPRSHSGDYYIGQEVEVDLKILGPVAMATVHYHKSVT